MERSTKRRELLPILLVAAVLAGAWTPVSAEDYNAADFSLRFPAGLTRFATYGDVAGVGGASAGSKWSSSVNPASQAWMPIKGKYKTCVSPQYSKVWFDNGSEFDVLAESATVDLGRWGTLMGAAAQINTNNEEMRNGFGFDWAGDVTQIQWAKKLTEDWAVGLNFGHTDSIVRNDLDIAGLGDINIAKSCSDSYAIRAGSLYKWADKFLGGLVVDYGWSRDRTKYYAIPGVMPEIHVNDTTRQVLVRPGVSYEYKKNSYVYADYQSGTFWNDTGTLNTHRLFLGVEHGLNDWIFARAGSVVDLCVGDTSWTAGLGFYPTSWLSVDVAYQYDMFPELSDEFGRSHTLNVSMSITF